MADFSASILRADDLLVLTFDLFNFALDPANPSPPTLRRIRADEAAFMVVNFPPQHLTEHVFHLDQGGQLQGLIASPVPSALSGPSRLSFKVPDGIQTIPFTLSGLLTWIAFTQQVTPNALPDPPPPGDLSAIAPAEPGLTDTAIELPFRMLLSPDASARWAHSLEAVTHEGTTELWHTRLGGSPPDSPAPVGSEDPGVSPSASFVDETRLPAVRAVWATDIGKQLFDSSDFTLSAEQRRSIVDLSSDFSASTSFFDPRTPENPFPVFHKIPYVPPPLHADHLILSALGGWTDLQGVWDFPGADAISFHSRQRPTVSAWRQVAAQGRDQYVRVVTPGYLFPFGHKAAKIEVTERKLRVSPDGSPVDYLGRRVSIVVLEPVKYYDRVSALNVNDHQLPLRVVRFTTVATPALDDGPPGSFLTIASTPFPFHIVAQDWDGRSVDLTLPMKFVLGSVDVSTLPSISVPLNGQKVALAPSRGDTSHSTATLKVLKLDIGAKPGTFPGALPFIAKAEVAVPAIDQLLGSANAPHRMTVTLVKPDPVSGDVFATLPEPVALNLPTDTAGGVVTPRFSIDRLSRSLGPVPCPPRPAGIPPKVDGLGGLDPSQMLSAFTHTKLLGDITLEKVIAKVDDVAGAARQLPTLLQRHLPTAIETSFIWAPTLQPDVPAPLVLNHTSSLTIAAVTRVPVNGGTPTFTVDGKLTDFALDFPGILRVSFSELTFHGGKGQKVSVTPKVAAVDFQGPLEFLTELADIIPKGDNSAGANVRVTAQGITAGFTLLIPAAGVGIFSIEQLGFSIELSLPFDGPLALRLGFSERSHPFLVTVSLIGGGGFLAIAMNSGGMQLLEGSIDLGANLTVGLGIVEANVHVLGGFYFALRDNQLEFSAFLRIGGSVELLGIAGISIEIYLALTFQVGPPKTIAGVASVTVGVHLLMFSTSVSLSVEKHFDIPSIGPGAMSANTFKTVTFEDLISPAAWETYCRAYA